ncbi:hypothetical protein GGR50DRAFT_88769 [Xylaria sp. CBS 124048]|nr:hypothetical protein GGR50DRAFT_88769 [Xylaria sp. CBS 124048]
MDAPPKAVSSSQGPAAKPFSSRASSSAGHGETPGGIASKKPWADQPWPLIEIPSINHHASHPALHIANQMAYIHNAMLRGLNAIYLQAPHVRELQDITDLLFLTQSWSAWLLDHHDLKEGIMFPRFEAILGVPTGTLTLPCRGSPRAASSHSGGGASTTTTNQGGGNDGDTHIGAEAQDEAISLLLYRVYVYASAIHKHPHTYNATVLEARLVSLADKLVPHLTAQIGLLASMREMCLGIAKTRGDDALPSPLPMSMVAITRTASHVSLSSTTPPSSSSPPISPVRAVSTTRSPPGHSSPRVTFSLYPSTQSPHRVRTRNTTTSTSTKAINSPDTDNGDKAPSDSKPRELEMRNNNTLGRTQTDAHRQAHREANTRASDLMKTYMAAEAQATASADRFVVPPMIVRLRDVTFSSSSSSSSSSPTASCSSLLSSSSGRSSRVTRSVSGNVGEWPWLSVLVVHAIADTLSGRHEGAWRFLPCDVWGRPRELLFLGA